MNLADKLYKSILLYNKIHHLPIEIKKQIMENPSLLSNYTNQINTDNFTV